ncbi:MAG: hypothetical protein IKT35_03985 [Clostridia bacterium]|nr:hypothetical protein [Clostridia bacterium]
MPKEANFCGACGTKFILRIFTQPNDPKKHLTNAVINKDIHNQKHSFWEYLGEAFLFGLMFVVVALGRPLILILGIPLLISLILMIRDDIRRSKLKYYVIERKCLEKKFVEGDDSPDAWRLWFQNKKGNLYVAIDVEKSFYDATEIGEEFYVVFLEKDKTPCLCYKKSEWIR